MTQHILPSPLGVLLCFQYLVSKAFQPTRPCKSMTQDSEAGEVRRSARSSILLEGKIYRSNGTSVSCKIRDLSSGGAKIEVPENERLPETFDLVIFEVKFRVCPSRLRWRDGTLAGVSFTNLRLR